MINYSDTVQLWELDYTETLNPRKKIEVIKAIIIIERLARIVFHEMKMYCQIFNRVIIIKVG